jgi:serine phosphatase RsbU (regulator of sigma subunit)
MVNEICLSGLPLGLFDGCGEDSFSTCTLKLGAGDVLLISSDGIGSIRGANGECFEDRRLRQVLTTLIGHEGDEVIADLMADACDFGWGRPIPDDINLVAISRNGHR